MLKKELDEIRTETATGCMLLSLVFAFFLFMCAITSFGGAFLVWLWDKPVSIALAAPLVLFTWFTYHVMVKLLAALRRNTDTA